MSRTLCSLGFLGLTLGLVTLSGEPITASDQARPVGHGPEVYNGSRQAGYRVVRTAQKTRKKGSSKKGAVAEPEKKPAAPEGEAKPAAPEEAGLKFSRDIAPIIVGNCIGCHNEKAMAKNGKLNLTSFETLKKGGADGEIVEPGKPEESHLYLRLT